LTNWINFLSSDLFDSSTTFQTIDEQLKQLDGPDDAQKEKIKRRRLGARGSVPNQKGACTSSAVTKNWLLSELDKVLEMPPEDLEQLQDGILEDLHPQPSSCADVNSKEYTKMPIPTSNSPRESSAEQEKPKSATRSKKQKAKFDYPFF
jgi:hypothetical protein